MPRPLYTAMDWLGERQAEIEKKLAKRHLEDGALVLYDVSSTYFEGKCCPLGQLGHSRDEKKDKFILYLPEALRPCNPGSSCTSQKHYVHVIPVADRLWPLMQPSGMSGGRGSV